MADTPAPPVPEPRPKNPISRPTTTGSTVTIACKLPHGIILRVFEWETVTELLRDGSVRDVKRARPLESLQITVRGTWVASGGQAYNPGSAMTRELLPGGYALTHGVPRETWERWCEQNKSSYLVENKIIFAYPTGDSGLEPEARANSGVMSGMEPVDPKNPAARLPGGTGSRAVRIDTLETS